MNVILTVGVLLIVLSFLFRKSLPPYWGFLFVFLIMGFQEGVEGDFMEYKETFNAINITGDSGMGDAFEYGWLILLQFFSFAPFWFFILCLSAFQCFVLFKFCIHFEDNDYHYLSAILFFFTFQMMLWQMKALGQGVAIELIVLAFLYADTKNSIFPSLIVAFIAFTIHNSIVVILPFFLLFLYVRHKSKGGMKDIFNTRFFPFIIAGVFFSFYILKQTILNKYFAGLALTMIGGDSGLHYSGYLDDSNTQEGLDSFLGNAISPLIVVYDAIMVFILAWFYRQSDSRMRVLSLISIVAAFGDMLFFGMGSLPRIFMYYTVFNIVVYPQITKTIEMRYGKVWAFIFVVFLIGYAWKTSVPWMLETVDDRFGTYHFVFW